MSEISQDTVRLSQAWGASFGDYNYVKWDGSVKTRFDFQDLLVEISENRAVTVESEVQPLSTRIMNRNRRLDKLGSALADLTKLQSQFDSDAKGTDRKGTLKQSSYETLQEVFGDQVDFTELKMTKSEVEYWLQMVKSKIDSLNNEANKDMTRLESLVDRRDEAYSTASDLMNKMSSGSLKLDKASEYIGHLADDSMVEWGAARAYLIDELGIDAEDLPEAVDSYTKRMEAINAIKAKVDELTQVQQTTMIDLQTLVNRRDVAYSTSSNIVRTIGTSMSKDSANFA